MPKLIILICVFIVKTISCKLIWLGSIMLLFWIKGNKLKFDSEKWDNFLLSLTARKVQIRAVFLYLLADLFTSTLSYYVFRFAGFRHGFLIAVIMFTAGILVSAYRWRKNYEMLFDKYCKMQKEIKNSKK